MDAIARSIVQIMSSAVTWERRLAEKALWSTSFTSLIRVISSLYSTGNSGFAGKDLPLGFNSKYWTPPWIKICSRVLVTGLYSSWKCRHLSCMQSKQRYYPRSINKTIFRAASSTGRGIIRELTKYWKYTKTNFYSSCIMRGIMPRTCVQLATIYK